MRSCLEELTDEHDNGEVTKRETYSSVRPYCIGRAGCRSMISTLNRRMRHQEEQSLQFIASWYLCCCTLGTPGVIRGGCLLCQDETVDRRARELMNGFESVVGLLVMIFAALLMLLFL